MKYILIIAIAVLLYSVNDYYQNSMKLVYSINEEEEKLKMYKSMISDCEQIAKLNLKEINYYQTDKPEKLNDEFEKYSFELANLTKKINVLASHSTMYLDIFSIQKDILSGELFFGDVDHIKIKAEVDEWYINSTKMETSRDGIYHLPMTDSYNIEYRKYSYNNCNKKIDTFNITRSVKNPFVH